MHLLELFVEPMIGNWTLPEYNYEDNNLVNQESDGYQAQCCIPSSPGANIIIRYGLLPDARPKRKLRLSAEVSLDGEYIGTFVDDEGLITRVTALVVSGTTEEDEDSVLLRPLQFTNRQYTDDENEARTNDGLGTIRIVLEWKRPVKQAYNTPPPEGLPELPKPVHPKKAKLLRGNDAVALGAPVPDDRFPGAINPEYDWEDAGYKPREFIFNYAPKSWIKDQRLDLVNPRRRIKYRYLGDAVGPDDGSSTSEGTPEPSRDPSPEAKDEDEPGPPGPDNHSAGAQDVVNIMEDVRHEQPHPDNQEMRSDRQRKRRSTLDVDVGALSSDSEIEILEVTPKPPKKRPKVEHKVIKKDDPEPGPSSNRPQPGPSNQPQPSPPSCPQNLQDKQTTLGKRARQLRGEVGTRSTLEPVQAEAKETRESDYRLASRLSQIINEYQDLVRELIQARGSTPSGSMNTFRTDADQIHKDARSSRRRLQGLKDGSMSYTHRWDLIAEFEQLLKDAEDVSGEILSSLDSGNGGEN
ncbi:hypothetical protein BDV93DRAFT_520520 [Ceratobasidium sp. AG-I]|nr:hypothetical protein BDV93DRAFT_520520 [Ceratobasidium sp. AG-I]